mmetsp:Transcript_2243/g.3614  ORF Transcript_2243/g.3614 Transcript_2243/m.3614 type:complete len:497 (+) Transcript_2243:119-1609(+)
MGMMMKDIHVWAAATVRRKRDLGLRINVEANRIHKAGKHSARRPEERVKAFRAGINGVDAPWQGSSLATQRTELGGALRAEFRGQLSAMEAHGSGIRATGEDFARRMRAASEAYRSSALQLGSSANTGSMDKGQSRSPSFGRFIDNTFAFIHGAKLFQALGGNGKYWEDGWGDPDLVAHLAELQSKRRESGRVGSLYLPTGTRPTAENGFSHVLGIEWKRLNQHATGETLWEGHFDSPVQDGSLPPESCRGRCLLLTPRGIESPEQGLGVPAWVHLPGLGDQGFAMRKWLAYPLARQGVASIILEGPFYGRRRPANQRGPKMRQVVELLALGNATIEESLGLLDWLRHSSYGSLGLCGFSMGGVHSMMAAACSRHPVALVCMLSPQSAAPVFCEGALVSASDWTKLYKDLNISMSAPPHRQREEAKHRLASMLSITDVTLLPPPPRPDATILVHADNDSYVDPRSGDIITAGSAYSPFTKIVVQCVLANELRLLKF